MRSRVTFVLVATLTVSACTPQVLHPPPNLDRVTVGGLRGWTDGRLLVSDAASRVEVETVALPGMLYRIVTPADSGLAPRVSVSRRVVRVRLRPTGGSGPDTVRILLNRALRWDIRLPAGAGEQRLDLVAGRVSRVELGAAGLVEMGLPAPRGRVPIVFREGVGTLVTSAPMRTCVRQAQDCYQVVRTP